MTKLSNILFYSIALGVTCFTLSLPSSMEAENSPHPNESQQVEMRQNFVAHEDEEAEQILKGQNPFLLSLNSIVTLTSTVTSTAIVSFTPFARLPDGTLYKAAPTLLSFPLPLGFPGIALNPVNISTNKKGSYLVGYIIESIGGAFNSTETLLCGGQITANLPVGSEFISIPLQQFFCSSLNSSTVMISGNFLVKTSLP